LSALGLGARLLVGHDQRAHVARQVERQQRCLHLHVDRLDHQHDLEPGRRVVELAQRLDQPRQHLGLPEQRHQDGIGGQLVVGKAGRCLVPGRAAAKQRLAQRHEAQQRHAQEGQGHRRRDHGQRGFRQHCQAADGEPDDERNRRWLPRSRARARRAFRPLPEEPAHGVVEPLPPAPLLQCRLDHRARCQRHGMAAPAQAYGLEHKVIGCAVAGCEHAYRPAFDVRRQARAGLGRE